MAKIYGLFGSMTGKLADTVMSVRNGEQIARKYQPMVYNPSTPAQVETRAKLKLLSQLSAVMAPVIAIPRKGNVSSRNLFVKENYDKTTYATDTANITLSDVQITRSVVGFPLVQAQREETKIVASLFSGDVAAGLDVNRVVYVMFEKDSSGKLRYVGQGVANTPGANGQWDADLPLTNNEVIVLGYGVRDNTERARVTFGNLQAITAEQVAKLITTSVLLESDVTLTETRGTTLPAVV